MYSLRKSRKSFCIAMGASKLIAPILNLTPSRGKGFLQLSRYCLSWIDSKFRRFPGFRSQSSTMDGLK